MSWIRNTGRNLVVASLRKKGDTIRWQNGRVLSQDEELSPTFEERVADPNPDPDWIRNPDPGGQK
jgi:hypothetical protein